MKTETIEKYPDRMKILEDTLRQVVTSDAYKAGTDKSGMPWELIQPGGQKDCAEYVKNIIAIGEEYGDFLRGAEEQAAKAKKKKG